jgi:hypothetical protein
VRRSSCCSRDRDVYAGESRDGSGAVGDARLIDASMTIYLGVDVNDEYVSRDVVYWWECKQTPWSLGVVMRCTALRWDVMINKEVSYVG